MDFFMNFIADILKRFGSKIPTVDFNFDKFPEMLAKIQPYLAEANIIFPIDDLLLMVIIITGLWSILMVIWMIQFIRNLLPF